MISAATLPAAGTRTTITSATSAADRAAHRHPAGSRRWPRSLVRRWLRAGHGQAAQGAAPAPGQAAAPASRQGPEAPKAPKPRRVKAPRPSRRPPKTVEGAGARATCSRSCRRRSSSSRAAGSRYFWLARPDSVAVPNVVHRDVFTAASTLKKAGFEVDSIVTDNPRPGGVVLAQTPRRGLKADEGSTVTITISDIVATVPEVVGTPVDDTLAALRHVGFVNVQVTDDYRDDVDSRHGRRRHARRVRRSVEDRPGLRLGRARSARDRPESGRRSTRPPPPRTSSSSASSSRRRTEAAARSPPAT